MASDDSLTPLILKHLSRRRSFDSGTMDWAKRGNPTWKKGEWREALDRFHPLTTEAESLTGRFVTVGPRSSVDAQTPLERRALSAGQYMAKGDHIAAVREKAFAFLECAGLPTDAASIAAGGQTLFVADALAFLEVGFAYRILHLSSLLKGANHCGIAFELGAVAREWQIVTNHGQTLRGRTRFDQAKPKGGTTSGKTRRADSDGPHLAKLVTDEEKKRGFPFADRIKAAGWLIRDHPKDAKGRKKTALAAALRRAGYTPQKT